MLYDNHGRIINYLRLAVTDRCNLRCFYCMPQEGIQFLKRQDLLTYEEMERIVRLFAQLGISKVRITGGEPFARKDLMSFLQRLSTIDGLEQLHITTNGTVNSQHIAQLKQLGISSVNLSLDSLDRERFYAITRRDYFDQVMNTFDQLLKHQIRTKLNMVVMPAHNIADILPMVELTKVHPISVRFLEEMPFNGSQENAQELWDQRMILEYLKQNYPNLTKIPDPPNSTSFNYQVPGYQGSIGIIASYSRLFCGTCNRIRLTPTGMLKTCLYDDGVFNIKDLLRAGATDEQMTTTLLEALSHRAKDGFEAEGRRDNSTISESMATIGG